MGDALAAAGVVLLAAMVTQNILLARFLGMCSFVAVSRNMVTAWGMGLAVTFVTFFTALLNYAIYHGVLVDGAPLAAVDLTFLGLLVYIMLIAGFVQLVEMVLERFSPVLHYNLGIYLPLITVNCAILGVTLFMLQEDLDLLKTAAFALGSGVGWLLAICLMAGLRAKLASADVPRPLKGLGITLIVTGLMAMAFLGFQGVVKLGGP
jgi:Na+-transporting NADH:ubiquinone oxidoreductase subunit E